MKRMNNSRRSVIRNQGDYKLSKKAMRDAVQLSKKSVSKLKFESIKEKLLMREPKVLSKFEKAVPKVIHNSGPIKVRMHREFLVNSSKTQLIEVSNSQLMEPSSKF